MKTQSPTLGRIVRVKYIPGVGAVDAIGKISECDVDSTDIYQVKLLQVREWAYEVEVEDTYGNWWVSRENFQFLSPEEEKIAKFIVAVKGFPENWEAQCTY